MKWPGRMNEDSRVFWQFIATLAAIVALSKIGGSGADLAIMTGLVAVLGLLARPAKQQGQNVENADTVNQGGGE